MIFLRALFHRIHRLDKCRKVISSQRIGNLTTVNYVQVRYLFQFSAIPSNVAPLQGITGSVNGRQNRAVYQHLRAILTDRVSNMQAPDRVASVAEKEITTEDSTAASTVVCGYKTSSHVFQ